MRAASVCAHVRGRVDWLFGRGWSLVIYVLNTFGARTRVQSAQDIDAAKVEAACRATGHHDRMQPVLASVEGARYDHMTKLLGDRLSKAEMLRIVRNQILIDIQVRTYVEVEGKRGEVVLFAGWTTPDVCHCFERLRIDRQ